MLLPRPPAGRLEVIPRLVCSWFVLGWYRCCGCAELDVSYPVSYPVLYRKAGDDPPGRLFRRVLWSLCFPHCDGRKLLDKLLYGGGLKVLCVGFGAGYCCLEAPVLLDLDVESSFSREDRRYG